MEFKIGDQVRIRQDHPDYWVRDWPGIYIVTGARLRYQSSGEIDYSLASPDEIEHCLGDTDGFLEEHLVRV